MGPERSRKRLRLEGYDYTTPGAYFVTMVTRRREPLFGQVVNGKMHLSPAGQVAAETWDWLPKQYPYVAVDAWVVMPDHTHGIIIIRPDMVIPGTLPLDRPEPKIKPLGQLVGAFKTVSAKKINLLRGTPGVSVWQRGYHERIIRSLRAWETIRAYIADNPRRWTERQRAEAAGGNGRDFATGTAGAGDGRDRPLLPNGHHPLPNGDRHLSDRHRSLPKREEALGYGE